VKSSRWKLSCISLALWMFLNVSVASAQTPTPKLSVSMSSTGMPSIRKYVQEPPDWLRRLLRVKAKVARFFHDNEKDTAEILTRVWKVDLPTATEWYRRCKPAFTPTGIPTDDEIKEFVDEEALALKLNESVAPNRIFDFLQRAVNKELGIKG
jgi:ABC-type nitrate/sulfonate/bicarbonate transport system substrate-binding protein